MVTGIKPKSRLSHRPSGTVFDWRLGRYVKEIG